MLVAALLAGPASADMPSPDPPPNPFVGPMGTATMHGDAESSDTTPHAGPGTGPVDVRYIPLAGACPTVLAGHDGMPVALCTSLADRSPTVYLLHPDNGLPVATLRLTAGNLLGGVYAYLDQHDRLVVADGSGDLLWIGHRHTPAGWELFIDRRIPLPTDGVVALAPDWQGRIWFVTGRAQAGYLDPANGRTTLVELAAGERIGNSISTAPEGVAITTDHALYLLRADPTGRPQVLWRRSYDRGPARKPGQLSWGSGATPTFFGPRTGTEYLTITDNAHPRPHLLVFDTRTGRPHCQVAVLPGAVDGTENSPVAHGRTIYVASTYGYPYPAYPDDAGPSEPESAPFEGGLTRVDLRDGSGCDVRWHSPVRSSAVPRLSLAEGLLYTFTRHGPLGGAETSPLDRYRATVVDPATGHELSSTPVGHTSALDTLQMVGTIDAGRVQYQGTLTGVVRIEPLDHS